MSRRDRALAAVGRLTATQAAAMRAVGAARREAGVVAEAAAPTRILVVRLDETIGDTVMFSPFLRELRRSNPAAEITLVVHEGRQDMYRGAPYPDHLVTTPLGTAADRRILRRPWDERRLAATLPGPFELALVPRVDYDHHAAFIAAASGAPRRAGFSERSTSRKRVVNRGTDRLLTDVLVAAPHRHEIDRQLDLLRLLGMEPVDDHPEVWLTAADREQAATALDEAGVADPFVVLAPSGGHSDLKRWPLERFAELAGAVAASGRRPLFIGGPGDRALFADLPDVVQAASVDLIGRLTPMGSAAVLERAAGFVGADSGLTHVAAALGRPTVAVFGPTCTHAFAPRGAAVHVIARNLPCGPCARGADIDRCDRCIFPTPLCMDTVSAAEAWDELALLLATA